MTDDLTMPEYTTMSGWDDAPASWSTELISDDDAINRCRHDKDRPSDCQTCPARARCDQLVREE